MSYLEELLPEFRQGAKIRIKKWEKGDYYVLKNGEVLNQDNEKVIRFFSEAVLTDQWELYQESEPDWDSIIKNKCLCWFWNNNENGKYLGTIRFINKNDELPFMNWERGYAKHCRPVRRDEVTFYEDRKDE